MSELILDIKNLTKRYKNNRGAFNVSFSLQRGDSFGLLGANGAGKTTVMKMLTGLCRPDSGEIKISGIDLEDNFENAIRNVGAVIEAPAFYPYLSAKKNLKLCARYFPEIGYTDDMLDEVLDSVSLLTYKDEKVSKYSLGMKQRLGIALSMIGKPSLYVLDEPSNGLDIEGRVDIRNIINSLSESGTSSFLISSHLSEEIEKTCNIVGIMKDGELCCVERMGTILSHYPNLETFYLKQIQSKIVKHGRRAS